MVALSLFVSGLPKRIKVHKGEANFVETLPALSINKFITNKQTMAVCLVVLVLRVAIHAVSYFVCSALHRSPFLDHLIVIYVGV